MTVLVMISSAFLLGYNDKSLDVAMERQEELKINQIHRTIQKTEIRPGISVIEAAVEQLMVDSPSIENEYLESWMENTLHFLKPKNSDIQMKIICENRSWKLSTCDTDCKNMGYEFKGNSSFVTSGGKLLNVKIVVKSFNSSTESN